MPKLSSLCHVVPLIGVLYAGSAAAMPASRPVVRAGQDIVDVQFQRPLERHRYGVGNRRFSHRHFDRGRGGIGLGAGLAGLAAGAIIGGAIAGAQGDVAPGPVADDQEAYCIDRFQSYDPGSGTYLGYDGQRHPCP